MANILMPDCLVKLNNLLQAIENAPVECDGHTLMISSALNHAGISHQRMCGVVKNPKTYFELYPHFWIEMRVGLSIFTLLEAFAHHLPWTLIY